MFDGYTDHLWEKEWTGDYIDLFGDGFDTMHIPMRPKKCDKLSAKLRKEGNALVNSGDWLNAMEKYNDSLRHAENDSNNISLAYGNRSLCFLRMKLYENCLADIDLALRANALGSRLCKRRDQCIELAKSDQNSAHVEVPQLFYVGDKNVLDAQKDNKISTESRVAGNLLFIKKDWLGALEKYNGCLRYAENDSENISLAYGNRSECLFNLKLYRQCLVDIECATESNNWMSKLEQRKADSSQLLNNEAAKNDFEIEIPELSYEVHPNFPGLANVLEVQKNDEFGRYISAKCDIPVGKTVLVEECFVSTLYDGKFKGCTACQDTVQNFIACSGCVDAMFCNEQCVKKASFHAMECGLVSPSGLQQSVFRSILTGIGMFKNFDELMKFVTGSIKTEMPSNVNDPKSQYRLFLNLNLKGSFGGNSRDFLESRHIYHIILNYPAVANLFNSIGKARFLMHLVAYHQLIISKNSIFDIQNSCQQISNLGVVFSLFNHQCVPNLLVLGLKDRLVAITQRPIKKGE